MKKTIPLFLIYILALASCKQTKELQITYNQTLQYDGMPPIELLSENGLNTNEVGNFVDTCVKTQPEFLIKNVQKIVLCDEKKYTEQGQSATSVAFADPNDMSVYIKIGVSMGAVTHELAHIYDYVQGYHFYSKSDQFRKLYESSKDTFHFYNDKNNEYSQDELLRYDKYFMEDGSEFFAECANLYWNDPEYLKKCSRDIYEYMDIIFGEKGNNK